MAILQSSNLLDRMSEWVNRPVSEMSYSEFARKTAEMGKAALPGTGVLLAAAILRNLNTLICWN